MADLSGTYLGRYKLISPLGRGGMAEVYRALDESLDREVAIKVIIVGKEVDDEFLKRFKREAKALAKLLHPNIVPVHDYGEANGAPYLVMDFLPGGTLKDALTAIDQAKQAELDEKGTPPPASRQPTHPMPYQKAARLLAPIARALEYAHQQNIIHRDIKPANILLTKSGQPMLSDFGIAKLLETDEATQLTSTGAGIGTPDYMAPEQWTGKVDARADIYSLGIVFYEMVTGRRPYKADTPAGVFLKHLSEPLPRPHLFVASLPQVVEQILDRALAKKPEERYQNSGEFAAALESLAVSGQHTVLAPAGNSGLQNRKAQATLAGVGLLLGGGVVLCAMLGLGVLILRPSFLYAPPENTPTIKAQELLVNTPTPAPQPTATEGLTSTPVSVDVCAERLPELPANNGDAETDSSTTSGGQGSISTRFSTSLSLDEVSSYYKTNLEAGGWKWWSSSTQSNGAVYVAYVIKEMKCMVNVNIQPNEYEQRTDVYLGLNLVK